MASSNDMYITKEYFDLRMDLQEAVFDRKLSDVKSELKEELSGVRKEISDVRTELKTEIAGVLTEMAELRTEVRGEMADMRAEMRVLSARVDNLVHWNYWVLALIGIIFVVVPIVKPFTEALGEFIKSWAHKKINNSVGNMPQNLTPTHE